MMTSSRRDHAEVAMARFARMHEIGGRAGRGEGRGDLAADMAGLAHAGDDQPALATARSAQRRRRAGRQAVLDRGDQRRDAAGLGVERAQRRIDQRARRRSVFAASRLPFVNFLGTRPTTSMETRREGDRNAPLTILVLHPLTISRACAAARMFYVRRVVSRVCHAGRRRRGHRRARGGACVRAAGGAAGHSLRPAFEDTRRRPASRRAAARAAPA